jgi:hypothetical protein
MSYEDDDEIILVDPTSELAREARGRLARPVALEGLTVGIMDIHKAPGEIFLDRLDELLTGRGITVKRYSKPRFSYEAPVPVKQRIAAECDVLIEGLAD